MNNKLAELEGYISYKDKQDLSISQANVGWQIHHSIFVINAICLTLMRSKEEDFVPKFNLKKKMIFATGKFPRGKAKAPKSVDKNDDISVEEINTGLKKARRLLEQINNLPKNSHFRHQIFGLLNLKDSKRFIEIHTEHHLKIIRDILKTT